MKTREEIIRRMKVYMIQFHKQTNSDIWYNKACTLQWVLNLSDKEMEDLWEEAANEIN